MNNQQLKFRSPSAMCKSKDSERTDQLSQITELIVPKFSANSAPSILPMLAHLSHTSDKRWLTWISSPISTKKSEYHKLGFDLMKTRFILEENKEKRYQLLCRCLEQGNSATVVADIHQINREDYYAIERASILGNCNCILIRSRSD